MTNFNYQKAYCVQALPAFNQMNYNQRNAHSKIAPLIGDLNQGRDLLIPMTPAIEEILNELSCSELAELSRSSYFVGHWYPGLIEKPFENKRGESWKISNCCDQVLRGRLDPLPSNIQIHQGVFRVTFSNENCWLWNEFGLANERNLEIFKNCELDFGENSIEKSSKILANLCCDLWPDVDEAPANEIYIDFLSKQKEKDLQKIKDLNTKKIQDLKKNVLIAETELKAFTWLIENGIDTDNCIYYSHKNIFSFGWRTPIREDEKASLSESLKDFPFQCEIK